MFPDLVRCPRGEECSRRGTWESFAVTDLVKIRQNCARLNFSQRIAAHRAFQFSRKLKRVASVRLFSGPEELATRDIDAAMPERRIVVSMDGWRPITSIFTSKTLITSTTNDNFLIGRPASNSRCGISEGSNPSLTGLAWNRQRREMHNS